MNERLKALYKSVILEHNKAPFFYDKNEEATYVLKAYNQICGDRFELYFEVKNGVIEDLTFHGFGCAISKASSSVLVKNLKGKTFEEALLLSQQFLSVTDEESETEYLDDEEVMKDVRTGPKLPPIYNKQYSCSVEDTCNDLLQELPLVLSKYANDINLTINQNNYSISCEIVMNNNIIELNLQLFNDKVNNISFIEFNKLGGDSIEFERLYYRH